MGISPAHSPTVPVCANESVLLPALLGLPAAVVTSSSPSAWQIISTQVSAATHLMDTLF